MLRRWLGEAVGASGEGGDQLDQMVRQAMGTVAVLELHECESMT